MIKTQLITDENNIPQAVVLDYKTYQEMIDKIDILESKQILKKDRFQSVDEAKKDLGL